MRGEEPIPSQRQSTILPLFAAQYAIPTSFNFLGSTNSLSLKKG